MMLNFALLVLVTLGVIGIAACSGLSAIGGQADGRTPVLGEEEVNAQFEKFKTDFDRTYTSPDEAYYRRQVFATNLKLIHRHNADYARGHHSYSLAVNHFADLTFEEFGERYLGASAPKIIGKSSYQMERVEAGQLPESIDWTERPGVVTRTKDQGDCGSCYAFSAIGALESQVALQTNQSVELSEQQIVDCSKPQGNHGCSGGWMSYSYDSIRTLGGIASEQSYPYQGQELGSCQFKPNSSVASVLGWYDLEVGSEEDLQAALATVGPVSIAISVGFSFQFYTGGVLDNEACCTDLNHAILAVGYDVTQDGVQYYKIKNSWGTWWGKGGFGLIARNRGNQCGIGKACTVPVVKTVG